MATTLNQTLLPEQFVAEARVKLGGQVEIDVGTFKENGIAPGQPAGTMYVLATEIAAGIGATIEAYPRHAGRLAAPHRHHFPIASRSPLP